MKAMAVLVLLCSAACAAEPPKVGDPAPDFALPSSSGATQTLAAVRGQWVVLYFYPKAFTPGCTAEACSLRDGYKEVQALGAVIFGVSLDGVAKLAEFREQYHLPFELLSDARKDASRAYGTLALGG